MHIRTVYSRKYTPSERKRPNSGHLNAPSGQGYSLISISDKIMEANHLLMRGLYDGKRRDRDN